MTEQMEHIPNMTEMTSAWETFRMEVMRLAEEHKMIGLVMSGIYAVQAGEDRISTPIFTTGIMPSIGSPKTLYALREQVLAGQRKVIDQSIERIMLEIEDSQQEEVVADA